MFSCIEGIGKRNGKGRTWDRTLLHTSGAHAREGNTYCKLESDTILNFTPTKVGSYPVVCAELCGPYHGGMRSTVVVENPQDYETWFEANSKDPVVAS